jgi:hypothetical protein
LIADDLNRNIPPEWEVTAIILRGDGWEATAGDAIGNYVMTTAVTIEAALLKAITAILEGDYWYVSKHNATPARPQLRLSDLGFQSTPINRRF